VVILSLGVRPSAKLAKDCGLLLSPGGAIVVNEHMQTSDANIYAAGDVCETAHIVTGEKGCMALAGPAAKQGRGEKFFD
jgi:NADPH-dependent 2,4-dienoyl-CoA reductase/sulfur reductase-like enzyme